VRESRIGFLARTEPADRVADLRATPPALPPTIPTPTIPTPEAPTPTTSTTAAAPPA